MLIKVNIFVDMTNQQLVDNGNRMMDETDQAIERSKKVRFSTTKYNYLQYFVWLEDNSNLTHQKTSIDFA